MYRQGPQTHVWYGRFGRDYRFVVFDIHALWPEGSILYAMVQRLASGQRIVLYFGQTGSGETRGPGHHKLDEAIKEGANELHVLQFRGTRQQRIDAESDLRWAYQPRLNEQNAKARAEAAAIGALPQQRAEIQGALEKYHGLVRALQPGSMTSEPRGGLAMATGFQPRYEGGVLGLAAALRSSDGLGAGALSSGGLGALANLPRRGGLLSD